MRNRLLVIALALILLAAITTLFLGKRSHGQPQRSQESAAQLYKQAMVLDSQGDLLAAKKILQALIEESPNSKQITEAQKSLENLNIRIIFSAAVTPQTKIYEVMPGDSLDKIAKTFNTTVELIKKSNNIPSNIIHPGQKLRVWADKFSIFVDKSQNILMLKSNDESIKTYRVSTGKNNCTPVGTFKITSKLTNPVWFKDGSVVPAESPDNVLGSRWLGFDIAGYGIHGTIEPGTIGQQVTEGCVRMLNNDVEELYAIVPLRTEVTIVD